MANNEILSKESVKEEVFSEEMLKKYIIESFSKVRFVTFSTTKEKDFFNSSTGDLHISEKSYREIISKYEKDVRTINHTLKESNENIADEELNNFKALIIKKNIKEHFKSIIGIPILEVVGMNIGATLILLLFPLGGIIWTRILGVPQNFEYIYFPFFPNVGPFSFMDILAMISVQIGYLFGIVTLITSLFVLIKIEEPAQFFSKLFARPILNWINSNND